MKKPDKGMWACRPKKWEKKMVSRQRRRKVEKNTKKELRNHYKGE